MHKRYLCAVVLVFTTVIVHAQQAPNSIGLKDLLRSVDQKAPALLTDSVAIAIRQAQAVEVRNGWLPNLKLNYQADVGTNNNTAGPYFGFGIIPSNSRGVRSEPNSNTVLSNLGIAALDWEVYNFGGYAAQNKLASADIQVEKSAYAQSKYQLEAFTIGNYLKLSQLEDLLVIQLRNIQRSQQIRRSIESLAKSGVRAGVDTSIADAELSKARLNYIELNDRVKKVQLQLAAISGIPYQAIVPDTTLSAKLLNRTTALPVLAADTGNHPLLNYYRSLYKGSLFKEELVRKQYNPKVLVEAAVWGRGASVDASDHFNSLSTGWGFNRNNYLVGIGISYNLFDLRRKQLKLRTQRLSTGYAMKKLEEQKAMLSLSVDQADTELNTAKLRMQEIPKQLKAATSGYRQKLSLYKSGLTDIIELNAALNILYRAETDQVVAKYAFTTALFQKAITENQINSLLDLLN